MLEKAYGRAEILSGLGYRGPAIDMNPGYMDGVAEVGAAGVRALGHHILVGDVYAGANFVQYRR